MLTGFTIRLLFCLLKVVEQVLFIDMYCTCDIISCETLNFAMKWPLFSMKIVWALKNLYIWIPETLLLRKEKNMALLHFTHVPVLTLQSVQYYCICNDRCRFIYTGCVIFISALDLFRYLLYFNKIKLSNLLILEIYTSTD